MVHDEAVLREVRKGVMTYKNVERCIMMLIFEFEKGQSYGVLVLLCSRFVDWNFMP